MACPCCGPKWACYQCCCPDGTAARSSISIQVTPNSNYLVPYKTFEGTYTLTLSLSSCLLYEFRSAADSTGCRPAAGDPSTIITFYQYRGGFNNGLVKTAWDFCGKDNQGRCIFAGSSSAYSSLNSYLCSGYSGYIGTFVFPVNLVSTGESVGNAGYDIYIQ